MRHTLRRGFSLLELSVVIGIISLIAGAGISLGSGALQAADRVATQERLNTIKLALDSYARTYGYLPCPYDRALVPSSANFGRESRGAPSTSCTASSPGVIGIPGTPTMYIGGIPVRTLGLPDSYAGDAWGGKLTYAVTAAHVANAAGYATGDGVLEVRYGDKTGTNYSTTTRRRTISYTGAADAGGGNTNFTVGTDPTTSIDGQYVHVYSAGNPQVYKGSYVGTRDDATTVTLTGLAWSANDTGTLTWQEPGPAASYVVVSHGPDGRGAFPLNGAAVPGVKLCNTSATANTSPPPCTSSASTQCNDIPNCDDTDGVFYDTAYNDAANPAQYFDDYIVWGSNAWARTAANPVLYESCNTECEGWCAECTNNYPGDFAITALGVSIADPVLCKKVIYSESSLCNASCFWSGTAGGAYQPCP
jgi:prepilin-type N-terminal cleavage/methylation domain-containing protein